MGEMFDSTDWQALEGLPGAKAGYIDGAESQWPAEAWAHFEGQELVYISVLGNPAALAFDYEQGNAPGPVMAEGVAIRTERRQPSLVYTDEANYGAATAALEAKELRWLDAEHWPAPGPYLWAADWTGAAHDSVKWAPFRPAAVQDVRGDSYDHSTVNVDLAAEPAPAPPSPPAPAPGPVPPNPGGITVNVPEVSVTAPGPSVVSPPVAAVQSILNGRNGEHLAVDGRFGPATDQAVRRFQVDRDIETDGVVGPVTWQHLVT